ncbi:MAG: hypothetical protein JRI68_27955 [Deltaproteobacteria bacterium]|nr:hypothetical protein [Deltaproteobacteria bacterium]
MTAPRQAALLLAAGVWVGGCSSASSYEPRYVGPGELTLRYDDGLQIFAGKALLADSPGYGGLTDYVRCVPIAAEHAEAAENDGSAAIGTGWAGGVLGVAGLGGLAGLAYLEEDETKAFAILGTGVAAGLLGISLAIISRSMKNSANGHAVDAVNYYNDSIGSLGGTCKRPPPPLPERSPEPPPPAEPEEPEAPEDPEATADPEPAEPAQPLPPGSVVEPLPGSEAESDADPKGERPDVPGESDGD